MLTDRKITTYVDNIKDLSDTPSSDGVTATDLKAKFDSRTDTEIKNAIKGIIDDLTSTTDGSSGADNIGVTPISGVTGNTAQTVLEGLKTVIDNAVLGQIPDNKLTNEKLGSDIKVGSLALLPTTEKSNLVGAISEVSTSLNTTNNNLATTNTNVTNIENVVNPNLVLTVEDVDANTITETTLCRGLNRPTTDVYYYIIPLFVGTKNNVAVKKQVALEYQGSRIFTRYKPFNGSWSNWTKAQTILEGTGSPDGVVTANVGAMYINSSGGATTTLYVKTSGTGNTGWAAK